MKIYNTLTKSVEEFIPMTPGKVTMFVCGPTVYDNSHLGHAKTYTQMDVLARVLKEYGYNVFYLQNITDIDDKIILRAKEDGLSYSELSKIFENKYYEDMKALNNSSVTKYARATDFIDSIVNQVNTLLDKGYAYTIPKDGIYFEVSKFSDYGKLSGRQKIAEDDAQSRIDDSKNKKGWNDFCLWKFAKPEDPKWDAPFGEGRPGWHIEDTAISKEFFGPQYDIHGGAIDLIFPHHEAEIAQMESISNKKPFVKYWVHSGFLTIKSSKMSKSKKNFFTIAETIRKGINPKTLRLFFLQSHYRSHIDFSHQNLQSVQNRLNSWQDACALVWQFPTSKTELSIIEELGNDLNTPEALSKIDKYFEKCLLTKKSPSKKSLELIDRVLGIDLSVADISTSQKALVSKRELARATKNWQESDKIRDQLASSHLRLKDSADGTIWSKTRYF